MIVLILFTSFLQSGVCLPQLSALDFVSSGASSAMQKSRQPKNLALIGCNEQDLDFTDETVAAYKITGHNTDLDIAFSANECRQRCRDYDRRIGTCTHYKVGSSGLLPLVNSKQAFLCLYFNGPMKVKSKDTGAFIKAKVIGRAYCRNEIRSIQQKATASWNKVITCRNPSSVASTCVYKKTVGVLKRSSTTSSNEVSASVEMGLTLGMETGDPLGAAKASMSASLTTSFGTTTGFSSSSTFQESTTETVTSGAPSVPPGKTVSICQAVGSIGEFTLNSPDFKVVDGDNCHTAASDAAFSGVNIFGG